MESDLGDRGVDVVCSVGKRYNVLRIDIVTPAGVVITKHLIAEPWLGAAAQDLVIHARSS